MYMVSIQVSKPLFLGRMSKYRSLQETDNDQHIGTVTIENTLQPGATKKLLSSKDKVRLCTFVRHLFFKTFY